ncbi:MAG: hypothetical protein LBN02_10225 [Oscillospiraceae bacterium]|nr:hypothetical protein [Oscillospiraceae bacterium]
MVTGASGAIPISDQGRRLEHAKRYYDEIRKRDSDIAAIAESTGHSEDEIRSVKAHVFLIYHELGYESPARFDPDYNMAVSWQRLIDGKDIQPEDFVLIEHELAELTLMNTQGLSYSDAHTIASLTHDYHSLIKEKEVTE